MNHAENAISCGKIASITAGVKLALGNQVASKMLPLSLFVIWYIALANPVL